MKVVVLSARRCGSTIVQNVAHVVLYRKKGQINKEHKYLKFKGNILLPIRDPRDVAVSIRRTKFFDLYSNNGKLKPIKDLEFLNKPFLLDQLDLMCDLYEKLKNDNNTLILRYEEIYKRGIGNYEKLVKMLCDFFDIEYNNNILKQVNALLDRDKLKEISDRIGDFKKTDMEDEAFRIHGNHIKTELVNDNWKNEIPTHLHKKFNARLKKYLNILNY